MSRPVSGFLVAVLLAGHWALAVTSSVTKSATFDEPDHLGGGYSYWTAGDFRFNAESGNLVQRWAALPLLVQELAPPDGEAPSLREAEANRVGRDLLYGPGNDAARILVSARAMTALWSVGLGAAVYAWSRSLFGRRGALLSLALYAWSPTVLAHSRLVTADLAVSLFLFLAVGSIWRLLRRVTAGRILAAALALVGLVLSKMSGLLVLPMAAVLVAVHLKISKTTAVVWGRRLRRIRSPLARGALLLGTAAGITVLVWGAVWGAYGFRYAADPRVESGESDFRLSWRHVTVGGWEMRTIGWARDHKLLPEAYLWGLAYTLFTAQRGAFLDGEHRHDGWVSFFPYAAAVKTPLALFGLLALSAAAAASRIVSRAGPGRDGRHRTFLGLADRMAPLTVLVLVYGASVVTSSLNLGHRHILPLYPVAFVAAGSAVAWPRHERRRRAAVAASVLLLVLFAAESQAIRPHYLSYFNRLAGGPHEGYRHLVDSSLDWGQDLPALARWIQAFRAREPGTPVYVSYFGAASPTHHGIEARWLYSYLPQGDPERLPARLEAGIYCVSATLLQSLYTARPGPWRPAWEAEYQELRGRVERYRGLAVQPGGRAVLESERSEKGWKKTFSAYSHLRSVRLFRFLVQRRPESRAAYSILIFRLDEEEARAVEQAPTERLFGPGEAV